MEQGIDQGAGPYSGSVMDDHSRPLVDHGQVLVLVNDLQRDGLRLQLDGTGGNEADVNVLSTLDSVTGLAGASFDPDVAGLNQRLNLGPAPAGKMVLQESIQAGSVTDVSPGFTSRFNSEREIVVSGKCCGGSLKTSSCFS